MVDKAIRTTGSVPVSSLMGHKSHKRVFYLYYMGRKQTWRDVSDLPVMDIQG